MLYKEVEIGGKKRPIKFGIQALRLFENQTGVDVLSLISQVYNNKIKMTFDQYAWMAYYGLKEGARKAGQEFTHTDQDITDWFDDSPAAMSEIANMFYESILLIFTEKKMKNENK